MGPRTIYETYSDIPGARKRGTSDLTFKPAVKLAQLVRDRRIGCLPSPTPALLSSRE